MSSPDLTLEQQRAARALHDIQQLTQRKYGNYVSHVSALPATIITNGLGQALAITLAKAKTPAEDPHRLLFDHVAGWLSDQVDGLRVPEGHNSTFILEQLMQANQDVYLRAQAESLAYVRWLKQFARAYLQGSEAGDE